MKTVREIIRLFSLELSVRKIALSCNISISTVSFYVNRFKSSGTTYDEFALLTDEEIKSRLFLKLPKEPKKVMPDMNYHRIPASFRLAGVLMLLRQEQSSVLFVKLD